MLVNFLVAAQLAASQEALSSIELVSYLVQRNINDNVTKFLLISHLLRYSRFVQMQVINKIWRKDFIVSLAFSVTLLHFLFTSFRLQ
jgi:hypothetical protein